MQCNARLSKEKRKARGAYIRTCSKKIQLAETQLQANPTSSEVKDILSRAQEKLAEVFQSSIERNHHLTSSSWLRYENTCSKSFFDFHRIGKKKTLLRELETEDGIIGGQSDLELYITGFYAKLHLGFLNPRRKGGSGGVLEKCLDQGDPGSKRKVGQGALP
jgi:hypothetical protein